MDLHEAHQGVQRHRRSKRLGRGAGSGRGKTAARGHKGQRSRSGSLPGATFEGGQMPLVRRIPKRGFNNRTRKVFVIVNLRDLEQRFEAGATVDLDALRGAGLIKGRFDGVKVLAEGELTKALTVAAHRFSKTARTKIEQAGGQINLL
jgi:large subunit ribosomal protein L15